MDADRTAYFVARQSRLKVGAGFTVCLLGFGLIGFAMVFGEPAPPRVMWIAWVILALLVLPIAIGLKQLIQPGWVRLSPAGVEAQLTLRRAFWPWRDIASLGLTERKSVLLIALNLTDGRQHRLPANWDRSPLEVARQLQEGVNRFRSTA